MSNSIRTLFSAALSASLMFSPIASAASNSALWFEHTDIQLPARTSVAQLENGLRYIILPTTKTSDEVSIRVRVGSGVAQEPADYPLARITALNSISGTDWLATSGYQQTVFSLDLAHGTDADIGRALDLIRSGLTTQIQTSQVSELLVKGQSSLTDIDQVIAAKQLQPLAVDQHWSALDAETLADTPLSSVHDFQAQQYIPQNITVAIAGAVSPRSAANLIDKSFADWKANKSASTHSLAAFTATPVTAQSVANDSSVSISSLKSVHNQTDSKALRKDMLIATLANKLLEQRIENALQQQHSLAKVVVDNQLVFNHKLLSQIRLTDLDVNERSKAQQIVQAEIKRAIASGFTQTEYEMVVSQVREQLQRQTRRQNADYTAQQADRLIEAVNSGSVYTAPSYDLDLLNFHVAHLNELDVSKELAKIWSQDDAVIL
ncbi:insulinase family protein [Vibrio sp. Hep-1b-8]|uniref:insulinase family protein n=1 Tax=Vibrio sp. Hep-1b-8 TaxID=2144187 RepID=UPI0014865352|nr:insulinase family protein [Vibrio sp. Hep-1b-8]